MIYMEGLAKYFEVINPGTEEEYLLCKIAFASISEITAFANAFVGIGQGFFTVDFADPLDLDAAIHKDFICGTITGSTTINLNNSTDGNAGMIKVLIDSTGGYTIALGTMFTKKLGETDIVTDADTENYISWRNVAGDIVYTIGQIV